MFPVPAWDRAIDDEKGLGDKVFVVCTVRDKISQNVSEARERLLLCVVNVRSYYRRIVMKSVKVSTFVFFGLAFVCFLSLVPGIQADTMVTVPNGDFSSPTVPSDPGWQDGLIPDHWSYTGTASEGLEIVGSGQAVYMNQTESGQVGTLSQNDIARAYMPSATNIR